MQELRKTTSDRITMPELITILGPTATGKTRLAALLADHAGGEVISADSRQVYRGMDMGTGKDLQDYLVEGRTVPHHLIDIADPGEEYNVFRFQRDFLHAYSDIITRKRKAIMCGGSGMYLEAVIMAYSLKPAGDNSQLREDTAGLSDQELADLLSGYQDLHNTTDTTSRERMLRALEIARSSGTDERVSNALKGIRHRVYGIRLDREEIRRRITSRLRQRLDEGMAGEVKALLAGGLRPEQLEFYGLEYKFLTQYVNGQISYNDMFQRLNSAIHQFAKRQMTWFRRMERNGVRINWIDGKLPAVGRLSMVLSDLGE